VLVRQSGTVDYAPTLSAMQAFTAQRGSGADAAHEDQLWVCQHRPVFTQGVSGKPEHLLHPGVIPLVQTDRGGQITYHGPGQIVAYPLLNLHRRGYFVKEYVHRLEQALIKTLGAFDVTGLRVPGAPGIYVRPQDPGAHAALPHGFAAGHLGKGAENLAKIAALGIKVSRGCTYHGLSLNVAMDLTPYQHINACGYPGLQTVDLCTLGVQASWDEVATVLTEKLRTYLAP
jgi:lipoyl(octanoyl) transferase